MLYTWFCKVLELVEPLSANIKLHQTGALVKVCMNFFPQGLYAMVVLSIKKHVGLGIHHSCLFDFGNVRVVKFVPFLVYVVEAIRCIVSSACRTMVTNDSSQFIQALPGNYMPLQNFRPGVTILVSPTLHLLHTATCMSQVIKFQTW
jgi:hypothetical protein